MSFNKPRFNKHYICGFIILVFTFSLWLGSTIKEWKEYYKAEGGILVVFHRDISDGERSALEEKYHSVAAVDRHSEDYALFLVKAPYYYNEMLAALKTEPLVLSAEADYGIHTLGFTNDHYSDTQWYLDNPGHYIQMLSEVQRKKNSVPDIDMDVTEAWKTMQDSTAEQREVVVAIIDTGVDYTHPDLAKNMWVNPNEIDGDGIDNDKNGYIDDIHGWDFYNGDASVCHYSYDEVQNSAKALKEDNDNHGTHIAGIIGAVADNNIGIAGVASNIKIKIMVLKITGGEKGKGNPSDAIEAIKYATMMGADICSISWGTTVYSSGLKKIMRESDMLFVAAAGNTGFNNDVEPMYPACFDLDNLLSVTAVNSYGELADYANYGSETVELAAPGDDIYSTVIGGYASMSGSSMAVPQVCGVAALLYSYQDHLYASNIKETIIKTMKPLGNLEGEIIHAGIPSAYQAVMTAKALDRDMEAPLLSFDTIYNKEMMMVPVKAEDKGTSGLRVVKWIVGEKTSKDFWRGVNGSSVIGGEASFAKGGLYTFYAADYAGNETIQTYEVIEDKTAPLISATYTVANNYKYRTVTVKATDNLSGIKRIKYLPGKKTAEAFLPEGGGVELALENGKVKFNVKSDGVYTVFASDNRGNNTVKLITVKTVKATDFSFVMNNKTLYVGDHYTMLVFIRPIGTTDKITYTSMNKDVAVVSSTGRVTALSPGITRIIARTSSGKKAVCTVVVRSNAS